MKMVDTNFFSGLKSLKEYENDKELIEGFKNHCVFIREGI